MTSAVAIIPARGGSKRIPRKNIRPFFGKPIIAYGIETALRSGLFESVVVSTDDADIAAVAREHGGQALMRPSALADDFTGTNAVVRQALQALAGAGTRYEFACCIYATAPFLRAEYLVQGFERLRASDRSFAFSVTTFEFPIQRALRMGADGRVDPMDARYSKVRSQDLEHAWHDAAQFYWGRAAAYLDEIELYSDASIGIPIPRHLVQDIDTLEDWRRAELMFGALDK